MADASQVELKWTDPDEAGLIKYLCEEKQFTEERVKKAIERLKATKGKGAQNRIESFFGPATTHHSSKRKEVPKPGAKGKGKPGSSGLKKMKK